MCNGRYGKQYLLAFGAVVGWAAGAMASVATLHVNVVDKNGNAMPDASIGYRLNDGVVKATPGGSGKWVIKNAGQKVTFEVSHPRWGQGTVEAILPNANEVSVTIRLAGKQPVVEINPNRAIGSPILDRRQPTSRGVQGQGSASAIQTPRASKRNYDVTNPQGPGTCGGGGDCCTATPGTPGCSDVACCTAVCTCDPYCCDVEWDSFCAEDGFVAGCGANILCPACAGGPAVCGPGNGDCCTPNGSPGCDDPQCCADVCAFDSFCCDVDWDAICADEAADICPALCGIPCDVICDPGKTPENEPDCGLTDLNGDGIPDDTVNGGCNSTPNIFSPIACGQSYCASGAFDPGIGFRDTDWYKVVLGVETTITWTVEADFDPVVGIVNNFGVDSCAGVNAFLTFAVGTPCSPTSVTACLPAGTWYLFVGADFTAPALCPSVYNATLTCEACVLPDNDDCDGATLINPGDTVLGSTVTATADAAPTCSGFTVTAPGVWYEVAGNGNTLTASLCNAGTNYDTKLHVYCPACDNLNCVIGDDDFCGFPPGYSQVEWCSEVGRNYFILVSGFGAATGDFELTLTDGAACGNPPTCMGVCGSGGDCCVAHAGPGCSDAACCQTVCAIDPFCCDVEWDGICADEAEQLCAECAPEPCDITCDLGGTKEFNSAPNVAIPDNLPAGVDSIINVPDAGLIADLNVDLSINHTWVGDLCVTLTHGGVTVNLAQEVGNATAGCGVAGFGCSADNWVNIILDDEGAGGALEGLCVANLTSPPNYTPLQALSAFDGMEKSGDWTLNVRDTAGGDTGTLISWSLHFVNQGAKTPEDEPNCGLPDDTVNGGCNSPSAPSDCCLAHATPGCDDAACQAAVCAADPFCCDVAWDGLCAGAATGTFCVALCAGTTFPYFSPITCGQTYCGTAAFDGGLRDTDWYEIVVATETEFTWTMNNAEFEWLIGMVETSPLGAPDCATATALDPFLIGDRCTGGSVTRCVPPGTYWWFVAPQFGAIVPCGAEYNITLTCVDCEAPEPPPNDLCADAIPLVLPANVSGSTDLASLDAFPACDFGAPTAPGVWYSVAGTGGTITASLCNPGTNYDTKLYAYCPDCTVPMCVEGDDDFCGFPPGFSQISWCSQIGATYQILVHGFGAATGNFELTVSSSGGPGSCTPLVSCLPPEPTGGCCVAGVCSIQTATNCAAQNGLYLGDGTNCNPPGGNSYVDTPNLAIPDSPAPAVSDTMNVPDSIVISDLNVDLVVTHTWVGDLTISLSHNATTVVLVDRPGVPASGFGCANDNYNIILDDEGTGGTIEALCAVPMTSPPNYVPNNPLSAFDGQDVQGIWTISAQDFAGGDVGTLNQWSLHLPGAGSVCPDAGACCIHPNCVVDTEANCLAAGGFYLGDDTACTIPGPANNYVDMPNLAIPDSPAPAVSDSLNVPDVFNVSDLNVDLVINHTWVGDLVVSLTHGITVVLIDRPGVPASGFGCSNDNYNIVLDDEGTGGTIEALCAVSMVSPPNYTPNNPLSAFDGMAANGIWTISVQDFAGGDVGTLAQWSLHFTSPGTPACEFPGACCNRITGVCMNDVLEDDCEGDWYKNETCDEITPPCELPEACCLPNGSCLFITPSACMSQGGTPRGPGTVCGGDPDGDGRDTLCGDNCPTVFNPGQEDVDNDGTGNACDCGDGLVVPGEQCDGGTCCTVTCTFASAATVCRPGAGVCDVAENCTGSSSVCPPDGFANDGVCRAAADICDLPESCNGSGVNCPPDGFVAGGTECRASAGDCDIAEACTGSSAACPADAFLIGSECRASTDVCDPAELCDGTGPDCPADAMITECIDGDACCPEGCNSETDADCPFEGIPTVSQWGLVVMALLLLTGWKAYFGRRQRPEIA